MKSSAPRRGPRGVLAWWRGLSEADKYRFYTRAVMQLILVSMVVATVITGTRPWSVLGMVIAGLAAIAGIESNPELAMRATARQRTVARQLSLLGLGGTWLISAVLAHAVVGPDAATSMRPVGSFSFLLGSVAVLPFLRYRWAALLTGSVVTGVLFAAEPPFIPMFTALLLVTGALLMCTTRLTVWGMRVITDLEQTRHAVAELQVAQERLRFARDLHDVVGRGFSAIAVKSELATRLSRSGAAEPAAAEMEQVRALAVSSLEEMRAVVRGYRDIDLGGEVDGARALLAAAGCALRVDGAAEAVPRRLHELAAWVVREGTTNIVRHSTATRAVLTLGSAGLTLYNDGAPRPGPARSGVRGLTERAVADGAELTTTAVEPDGFTLSIRWEA